MLLGLLAKHPASYTRHGKVFIYSILLIKIRLPKPSLLGSLSLKSNKAGDKSVEVGNTFTTGIFSTKGSWDLDHRSENRYCIRFCLQEE
jgi:hypothetical protein